MTESHRATAFDASIERAWLAFRIDLGETLAAGLAARELEPFRIVVSRRRTVLVEVVDDEVSFYFENDELGGRDDEEHRWGNPDEAAHELVAILRGEWGVLHPELLLPAIEQAPASVVDVDEEPEVVVPTLGEAESTAELQSWMVAAFNAVRSEPLVVRANREVSFQIRRDRVVHVRVRGRGWIEIYTVLGQDVGFKKTRKLMNELMAAHPVHRFFLVQDVLIMSQMVPARPFSADQLIRQFRHFVWTADSLGWVAARVLRKRAANEEEGADLEARPRLAGIEVELRQVRADNAAGRHREAQGHAQVQVVELQKQIRRLRQELAGARHDRAAAQAQLRELKRLLREALAERPSRPTTSGDTR